jgi:hypothetical protein
MEFPVVKEIYRDDLNNDKLENLVNSPSLHVLDASAFEPKELFSFIQEINEKRYLLFPFGMLLLITKKQVSELKTVSRPPLVNFVESVEQKEVYIEDFYKARKSGKSSSTLYELLLGQTWSQVNDAENNKLMLEMGKWKSRLNDIEKENLVLEFVNKHIS